MSRKVWFQLVNREGHAIGTVDFVDCATNASVARLRDAVQMKYSNSHLARVATSDLRVFANRAAYDAKQELEEDSPIGTLGGSKRFALIIADMHEETEQKKLKTSAEEIEQELIDSIGRNLEIGTWPVGGKYLELCRIEPDFPKWFYVRKETIDIIKVFECQMKEEMNILFKGTPGVGKSMLVVLFAFYMALIQNKSVVLFRKRFDKGFSLLYLNAKKKIFWRMNKAKMQDLYLHWDKFLGAELCLDGFLYEDVMRHFDVLGGFRLLATSAPFNFKDGDYAVRRKCLVPFWSISDLNAIGTHLKWTEHELKKRYYHSGGNLTAFLTDPGSWRNFIYEAAATVKSIDAEVFSTQYGSASENQVDLLRTVGVQKNDHCGLKKYLSGKHWICVITSEYALRKLGYYVKPSYCEKLWSYGRMLKDDGLMGMAFENYVHALARDGKKIELQLRAYDRVKARQHSYVAFDLEAKLYRNDDYSSDEVDMKRLASSSGNYWYPFRCCLKTIDSVAKLNIRGQLNTIGLIQITTSNKHTIDSIVVDNYASFFSNSRYIALVPNKEICDNFRLVPANPTTKVPLDVAYITTRSF